MRFGAASRRVLALDPGSPSTPLRSVPGVRERAVERLALIFPPLSRAHAAKAEATRDPAQDSAAKRRRTLCAEVSNRTRNARQGRRCEGDRRKGEEDASESAAQPTP